MFAMYHKAIVTCRDIHAM